MTSDVQGTQVAWDSAELDVAPCGPKALGRILCIASVARVPGPRVLWSSVERNAGTQLWAWGINGPASQPEPQPVGPPAFCYLVCSAAVENQPQ